MALARHGWHTFVTGIVSSKAFKRHLLSIAIESGNTVHGVAIFLNLQDSAHWMCYETHNTSMCSRI